MQLKVAQGIAHISSRNPSKISAEDWWLASIVMRVSDRTLAKVKAARTKAAAAENMSRGKAEGAREIARQQVVESEQAKRVRKIILQRLKDQGRQTRGKLNKALRSELRALLDGELYRLIKAGTIQEINGEYELF